MEIRTVGVLGAGQMGAGIAQVAAMSGYEVLLTDISEAQLERARATIDKSLSKLVAKERITADARDAELGKLTLDTEMSRHRDADLVVEAVTENEALKLQLLGQLDALMAPEAILATNTGCLP